MVQEADTYLTPELRASVGTEVERMVSYPVGAGDIRRWAIAVYWPETPPRLFWTRHTPQDDALPGIIAPRSSTRFPGRRNGRPRRPTRWRRGQRTRHSVHEWGQPEYVPTADPAVT